MKPSTWFVVIVLMGTAVAMQAEQMCLTDGFCAPKCCMANQQYHLDSKLCRSVSGAATASRFVSCPGGEWLRDVKGKPETTDGRVECLENMHTFDNETILAAMVCPEPERQGRSRRLTASQDQQMLNKCCPDDQSYDIGNQNCIENDAPIPWVHSLSDELNVKFTDELIQCPTGSFVKSSRNFHLSEDSTISIDGDRYISQFCVGRVEGSTPKIAVRFCAPDPCVHGSGQCLRKCCPIGYAMDGKSCAPVDQQMDVKFRNETGELVPVQLPVRAGKKPDCAHGIQLLDPVEYEEDEFFVLPSGKLYVPEFPVPEFDEYCVENFVNNGTLELKALICFPEPPHVLTPGEMLVLKLYPYMMFVSAAFLVATFVVHAIVPELRNSHGVTIMCHVGSLAATYICLGVIQVKPDLPMVACIGFAVVTHFSFLASFTWLNVMSFDIWMTFNFLSDNVESATYWLELLSTSSNHPRPMASDEPQPSTKMMDEGVPSDREACDEAESDLGVGGFRARSSRNRHRLGRRFIWYSVYAWGLPLVIVAVGQILDNVPTTILRPNFGVVKCWFADRMSMLAYFYGPIAVILLSNLIFFVLTAIRLHQTRLDSAFATKNQQNKQNCMVIFGLFVLMGIGWVTEIVTWSIPDSVYYSIPTDILNILTGLFIFCIFVCKRKVLRLLRNRLQPIEHVFRRGTKLSATQTTNSSLVNNSRKATSTTNVTAIQ